MYVVVSVQGVSVIEMFLISNVNEDEDTETKMKKKTNGTDKMMNDMNVGWSEEEMEQEK